MPQKRKPAEEAPMDANDHYNHGLGLMKSIQGPLTSMKLDAKARKVAADAEASLKKALALADNHGRAHIMLGMLYRYTGVPKNSLPHFKRGMELPPESADWLKACDGLGSALMALNDGPGALKVLREGLLNHPMESMLHFKIGACLVDAGDKDGAKLALESALGLNPDYADARNMLDSLGGPAVPAGPPPGTDYAAAGAEAERLGKELQAAMMKLMAGKGKPEDKTAKAMTLQEEFQMKIKALYGA
jgi:tetratricopeptide (TPR) repeat protein